MKITKYFIYVTLLSLIFGINIPLSAQINFISNGGTKYTIIIPNSDSRYYNSANILQSNILNSSRAKIAIKEGNIREINSIVICTLKDAQAIGLYKNKVLVNGGVLLDLQPGHIMLIAQDTATLDYPVYEFLQQYFNAQCYNPNGVYIDQMQNLTLPVTTYLYSSPFYYRDVYYYNAFDQTFKRWNRVKHIMQDNSEWGNFVHTINQFMGFPRYFKSNPEYFALINGKRTASQVCYSNPEVYQIVKSSLIQTMKGKPDKKVWSVSQMDNNDFCQCDNCQRINQQMGTIGGTMALFVNKLAMEIPEKTISMLAYGATMPAPKNIRLAKNLNVVFCATFGNKAQSITTDPSAANVRESLDNWLQLTHNIIIWDYVVNFRNLLTPLPNYDILATNIRYYASKGIVGVFIQGDAQYGGEFAGLRSYLLSKLLWNPQLDAEKLTSDYIGYTYDGAKDDVIQLVKLLSSAGKSAVVSNYDNPVKYSTNIFSDNNVRQYQSIMQNALQKVQTGSKYYNAVKEIGLWLGYTEVEIMKGRLTASNDKAAALRNMQVEMQGLNMNYGKDLSNSVINEGGTKLSTYLANNNQLAEMKIKPNKLLANAKITILNPYTLPFTGGGNNALIDGIEGSVGDLYNFWQGYYDKDLSVMVDMGKVNLLDSVGINLLNYPKANVYLPPSLVFSFSIDGKTFVTGDSLTFSPKKDMNAQSVTKACIKIGRGIRFIKIVATKNDFPVKSWLVADEIIAKK